MISSFFVQNLKNRNNARIKNQVVTTVIETGQPWLPFPYSITKGKFCSFSGNGMKNAIFGPSTKGGVINCIA